MSMSTVSLHELSRYPRKIEAPFQKLLQAGQLDDEAMSVILAAGRLDPGIQKDSQRLLSFAVGYLYLQSQGVPIRDTIRMASDLRRRINLGWSPTRWKQEHDRLSRLATLKRLAGANVVYDLSAFDLVMPGGISGYLIRTSRRLGMEGLRQRHCVASYHDQVNSGHCAIAAVFAAGQRWTVQLYLTGNAEQPLRIGQIKGRYNALPPREVNLHIRGMMGISIKDNAVVDATSAPAGRLYMENLRRVLPHLRAADVGEVRVTFDGGGDSGSIQSVDYDIQLNETDIVVDVLVNSRHFDEGNWVVSQETVRKSLSDAIEVIADDYLEETDVDWYDADGGYGEMVINAAEGTVSMEINTRYTETTCAFSNTREIETGLEID